MMPIRKLKEQALQSPCFAVSIADRKLCFHPSLHCFLVSNNRDTVKHLFSILKYNWHQSMEFPYNIDHVLSRIFIFKNDTKMNLI